MINFHQIKSGGDAAKYHEKAFVADGNIKGADNYYAEKSATATWEGNAARILGIQGEQVKREDFVNFLEGKFTNPLSGIEQDLKANGHENRRPGIDLPVAPPKSVSVVALVGGDERLVQAHEAANKKAMGWLEEHAAVIRVGKDGSPEQTGNLIYATIQHETNRENEPHLHNHNVVMAATYDTKRDTWRSLTNDEVLKLRAMADEVYKAELNSLVRKAGYQVESTKDGFEIVGISKEQIEAFSGRTKQIDDAIRALGYDPELASWGVRQAATLDTRAPKKEVTAEVLHEVWANRANEVGLDLASIVGAARERAPDVVANWHVQEGEGKRLASLAVSQAVEHEATREQVFSIQQLEGKATYFGNGNVKIDDVKEAIQAHITGKQLVEHEGLEGVGQRYTTQRAIYSENLLVSTIEAAKGTGTPLLSSEEKFNSLLSEWQDKKTAEINIGRAPEEWAKFQLSSEQHEAAKNIILHKDGIQGVQGDAGTGKTAGLEFVKYVADKEGWLTVGTATAASASAEIQHSTNIESNTMASYFAQKGNAERLLSDEIEGLRMKLQEKFLDKPTGVEIKTLEVRSKDIDFGKAQYHFDHDNGRVYRETKTLSTQVGELLLEQAGKYKPSDLANSPSLGDRLKLTVIDKVEGLGNKLISNPSLKAVEHPVEANAARTALYAANRAERQGSIISVIKSKEAELTNWKVFGNAKGMKMLFVLDEASMTGIHDGARWLHDVANLRGARVVLQGDVGQHSSVAAGRMYAQAQAAGMNTSVLEETMRFKYADVRQQAAVVAIKGRGYAEAIMMLNPVQVTEDRVREVPAERYVENFKKQQNDGIKTPLIDVVVHTNADRKEINSNVHRLLGAENLIGIENKSKEHFDNSLLTAPELRFTKSLSKDGVNRLVFGQRYQELGIKSGDVLIVTSYDLGANRIHGRVESTGRVVSINPEEKIAFTAHRLEHRAFSVGDKVETRNTVRPDGGNDVKLKNGARGYVVAVDDRTTTIEWGDKKVTLLTNNQMRSVDFAYAHTSQKDQGATYAVEIWAVSSSGAKAVNAQAAYVSLTRARVNTEIYTSDLKTMLVKAGVDVQKTTAINLPDLDWGGESFKVRKLAEAQSMLDSADVSSNKGQSKTGAVEKNLEPTQGVDRDQGKAAEKGVVKGAEKATDLSR